MKIGDLFRLDVISEEQTLAYTTRSGAVVDVMLFVLAAVTVSVLLILRARRREKARRDAEELRRLDREHQEAAASRKEETKSR